MLLTLLAAVIIGGVAAWTAHVFRTAAWSHKLMAATATLAAVQRAGDAEDPEAFAELVILPAGQAATPVFVLLDATGRLDAASRKAFGQPMTLHPLPAPFAADPEAYPRPVDSIYIRDDFGRAVELVRQADGWAVDLRPYVEEAVSASQAAAMSEALGELATRIEAGDFATFEEAQAAVGPSIFLGSLKSIGPATQPK